MFEMLANLLSGAASLSVGQARTWWLFWDEPECPEELI